MMVFKNKQMAGGIKMKETELQILAAMEVLDEDSLLAAVRKLVDAGYTSHSIEALLQQGMRKVEKLFESGTYFLADLIVSGVMFQSALELLPIAQVSTENGGYCGKVLMGVVSGDIHDIGKDIVAQVLRTEQFEILDLGVDVSIEDFVRKAKEYQPDIIALSGVMGNSSTEMKKVIDALEENGIRACTPVIVGGSCVNKQILKYVGADAYAKGPVDTMLFCKDVMENKRKK